MQFDYFYPEESENYVFYRTPKVLCTDKRFRGLSSDAKLLYGILLDRIQLSKKNRWIDEEGHVLGLQVGESRGTIKRFLRIAELIPALLDLVDQKRIPISVAVEMSFFTRSIQGWIHEYCTEVRIPKWNELAELRSGVPQKDITRENLFEYLNGKKAVPDAPEKIVFTRRKLNLYFPKYMSTPERERIIISLLEKWKEEQDNKRQ